MNVGLDVLRRFVDLPADAHQTRLLLDLCGLEVKGVEHDGVAETFTLELLANRGDHHCYEGLARELHGHTGAPFRPLSPRPLQVGASPVPVAIETDLCMVYTATRFEGGGGKLDDAARRTLVASGLEPISAAVDATNVVNLELGQPTHAFDADAIDGGITVRLSRPGERAWPLFAAEPVDVPPGTVVIADERKILGIAGVIGCEDSKATDTTQRLVLESATFDPVAVRKARRALNLSTDASARFERGGDPARPLVGAARVAELLVGTGAWRVVGTTGAFGRWAKGGPTRAIALDLDAARRFLAIDRPDDELVERLSRYGFAVERAARCVVHVPSWRTWDVEHVSDLHEELAKSVGYEAVPAELPVIDRGSLPAPSEVRRARIEEVLLGNGFYEVFTDGFYGRDVFAKLGLAEGDPLSAHVEVTNALDRGYSLLKNNTLHQAIEAVAVNERRRNTDVKMFEFTRTFHPKPGAGPDRATPPSAERPVVWMIAAGRDRPRGWEDTARPADVWFLRGVLEELAVDLGRAVTFETGDHPLGRHLHPGRQARILLDGEPAGILGEVHPGVARRYKLKGRAVFAELDWAVIDRAGARPGYVEPPNTQAIIRSLAFELPYRLTAGAVAARLRAAGPVWLERVGVTDLFVPPDAAPGARSVTFELQFSNPEANRTADEVNAAVDAIIRAALDEFGARGVRQR